MYVFVMDPQEFMDAVCILWAPLAKMTRGIFPLKFNGNALDFFFFFNRFMFVEDLA